MLATTSEIIELFKTPLTTFRQGAVIQKLLLGSAALENETLAATRALSLLENVELRTLFLLTYPCVTISDSDLNSSESLMSIKDVLLPYYRVTGRAITELEANLPLETSNLLRDYLVKESPLYYVAVNIFVVVTMVLIEAGEV